VKLKLRRALGLVWKLPMPFGDSWAPSGCGGGGDGGGGDKVYGVDRQWNDGSWAGIQYFEIGGMGCSGSTKTIEHRGGGE